MMRLCGVAMAGLTIFAFAGCGSSATLPTASYSPGNVAAEAMTMYDANKDGKLDAAELKKCPGLAGSLAEIDTNNDKAIDAGEIAARIASYTTSGTKFRDAPTRVVRRGNPVAGVTVTLEPEKFMLGAIKPASGVSNESGEVTMQTEGVSFPGAQIGFYQITVSQKTASGKVLGVEVAPSNRVNVVIDLDK
jgi:hypothetical protein